MSRAGRRTERALARAERHRFRSERTAGRAQARRVDDSRDLWRRQRGYLAACFLFTSVFLVFAAGLASELARGSVSSGGELAADLLTLLVSPVLAWATGRRARLLERRIVSKVHPADWLPPGPGEDRLDFDVQTARLAGLVSRATFVGLECTALVGLGAFIADLGDADAARLLRTGTSAVGTVMSTHEDRGYGDASIVVSYPAPGRQRFTTISWDTDRWYRPGDAVTVLFDPADSGRARTVEEPNVNGIFAVLGISLAIAGGAGVLISLPSAFGWRRRHQSVRETGWYPAEATVSATLDGGMPSITARYADGSQVVLKSALSLNDARFVGRSAQRVWIGGTDERMVVLHPHGRWRSKPYAVPARGRKPRDPGPRR